MTLEYGVIFSLHKKYYIKRIQEKINYYIRKTIGLTKNNVKSPIG
jgi:hypothetical protein